MNNDTDVFSQLYVDESVEIDQFHKHEALDRTYMILCIAEQHLRNHPFIQQDEEIKKLLDDGLDKLAEMYQLIGTKTL